MKYSIFILFFSSLIFAENPYVVDENSIHKENYIWTMKLKRNGGGKIIDPIQTPNVIIESLDKYVLHIKIADSAKYRWEAPLLNPSKGSKYEKTLMEKMGFTLNESPFGFKVVDPSSSESVAEMSQNTGSFDFYDKYLEMGMTFQGTSIMGAGERVTKSFFLCNAPEKKHCSYVLFGKDNASPIDEENGGCPQTYGQQPFLLIQLPSKKFMASFLHNTNDRQIEIDKGTKTYKVTHKMVGGIFDLYLFYPGTAEFVIQKYHDLIGRPYLPPMWSLGYHQCRYGWKNLAKVKDVVSKFEQNDIPLDVVWADIDYMKDYADFTIDPVNYKGLGDFVKDLHSRKIQWVPIIDAGLKYDLNDKYYKLGEEHKTFIKSAVTKKTLVGKVWPGFAVFPSWYSPYSFTLWKMGLKDLYDQAPFDGIWIDMNEIANFCRGECPPKEEIEAKSMLRRSLNADPHDPNEFNNLPFKPGGCDLDDKTVSMTGYHPSTTEDEDRTRKEYNTHSIWSLYEAKATYDFQVENLKVRPFVLTRSNSPGSGMYTTKWLGDNHSRWEYMTYSIGGIYSYQLFGVPFVGADMCGFLGDTTEELCARWQQLGAFTPFTRNHNDIHSHDQEPYVFGKKVIDATRYATRQKYSIAMYYYTKLFEVSLNGGTLIRPLFFEFPDDPGVYSKTDYMFMIGPALLVVPTLHENLQKTYPYCINEDWYNLKDFTKVFSYDPKRTVGKQIELESKYDYVNVLMKGGSIIPFQDAVKLKLRRIKSLPANAMQLLIAPDHTGKASGTLVLDDGISLKTIEDKKYRYLEFSFDMPNKKLSVNVKNSWDGLTTKSEMVASILIFGAASWKDMKTLCITTTSGKSIGMKGAFDDVKGNLEFKQPASEIYWKDVKMIEFNKSC